MNWLVEIEKEAKHRQARQKAALEVLRANPLLPQTWMTPAASIDWLPFFVWSWTSCSFGTLGVTEALRFRTASLTCRRALELDPEWRAVTLLSPGRAQSAREHPALIAKQWAAAHEKIMHFCIERGVIEFRLELGEIPVALEETYARHEALRFKVSHACPAGAVARTLIGYYGFDGDDDDYTGVDWSEEFAPKDFEDHFRGGESMRAIALYRNSRHVLAEVRQDNPEQDGFEEHNINALEPVLFMHPWGHDEFALNLELRIPTPFFSVLLGLGAGTNRFYPFAPLLSEPDSDIVAARTPTRLLIIGVLWSSQGVERYPGRDDDKSFDFDRDHHGKYSRKFSAELPQPPFCSCPFMEVPDYAELIQASGSPTNLPSVNCLHFDIPTGITDDEWECDEQTYDVDQVSIWILDDWGCTRVALHGLRMAGRLSTATKRKAFSMEGRLVISFRGGRARFSFIDDMSICKLFGG